MNPDDTLKVGNLVQRDAKLGLVVQTPSAPFDESFAAKIGILDGIAKDQIHSDLNEADEHLRSVQRDIKAAIVRYGRVFRIQREALESIKEEIRRRDEESFVVHWFEESEREFFDQHNMPDDLEVVSP